MRRGSEVGALAVSALLISATGLAAFAALAGLWSLALSALAVAGIMALWLAVTGGAP
jgi:hypothetical protein